MIMETSSQIARIAWLYCPVRLQRLEAHADAAWAVHRVVFPRWSDRVGGLTSALLYLPESPCEEIRRALERGQRRVRQCIWNRCSTPAQIELVNTLCCVQEYSDSAS